MSDFNRLVSKYTIKEASRIKKICEPLRVAFGVKHFWFSKTTPEGNYFTLASNPEMHEFYHASNMHLHSPFFHDPALIEPGFYFYGTIKDPKFQESFETCSNKLGLAFGGSLVQKEQDTLVRFGYAFDKAVDQNVANLILNNLPLLEKFNAYFAKETQELMHRAEDDFVHLPQVMGQAYHLKPKGLHRSLTPLEKCLFFERLGLLKAEGVKKLSRRELQLLSYVHEGYSARLIAEALSLSPRTVEKNLEMIKNKLTCYCKTDLCQVANLLKQAGFF